MAALTDGLGDAVFLPRKGRAMEKGLCYGAMGVAALMLLLFLLDLIVGVPFGGPTPFLVVDIFGLLAAGIIGYLGWNTFRDLQ